MLKLLIALIIWTLSLVPVEPVQLIEVQPTVQGSTDSVVQEINELRSNHSLPPLKESACLKQSAQKKIEDMNSNHYWGHENNGVKFSKFVWEFCQYNYVGENLAISIPKDKVVDAWIDSPKHLEILLDPRFKYVNYSVGKVDLKSEGIGDVITLHVGG